METSKIKVGENIVFIGYSTPPEDGTNFLTPGEVYKVVETTEDEIIVEVSNPNFNDKEKVSSKNSKTVSIALFHDEVEAARPAKAQETKAQETKVKAKAKAENTNNDHDHDDTDDTDDDDEYIDEQDDSDVAIAEKETSHVRAAKNKTATETVTKNKPVKAAQEQSKEQSKEKSKEKSKLAARKKETLNEDYEEDLHLETEDEEVLALINAHKNILELTEELVEEGASLDYKLGGVLFHVRREKAYRTLDPSYAERGGFEKYVNERLGLEYRKTMYLIDIYYKFNLFGIPGAKVAEIGWTKASQIARVMTEENAEELLTLAKETTVSDLRDSIKEDFVDTTNPENKTRAKRITFKFRLFEDQAAVVDGVLKRAMDHLGYADINMAFEHIVTEWATENLDTKKRHVA